MSCTLFVVAVGAAPVKRSSREDVGHKRDPTMRAAIRASKRKLSHARRALQTTRTAPADQVAHSCVEWLAEDLRQPRNSQNPSRDFQHLASSERRSGLTKPQPGPADAAMGR